MLSDANGKALEATSTGGRGPGEVGHIIGLGGAIEGLCRIIKDLSTAVGMLNAKVELLREGVNAGLRAAEAKNVELKAALDAQHCEIEQLKSVCSSPAAPDHSAEAVEFVLLGEGGEEHPAAHALP